MAKVKKVEDIPAWFKLENYAYLRELGATGWAIVVSVLDDVIQADITPELLEQISAEGGPKMSADEIFSPVLAGSLDSEAVAKRWTNYSISKHKSDPERFCFRGVSSLSNSVVSYMAAELAAIPRGGDSLKLARARLKAEAESGKRASKARVPKIDPEQIKFEGQPFFLTLLNARSKDDPFLTPNRAISVNMELPDAMLIDDFKEWLSETRKLALHKAAPKSFTRRHFTKWVDDRYVPLLLLALWARAAGTEFTYQTLAAALFPKRGNIGEGNIRRSILPAAKAWCCYETREALAAQAAKEAGR